MNKYYLNMTIVEYIMHRSKQRNIQNFAAQVNLVGMLKIENFDSCQQGGSPAKVQQFHSITDEDNWGEVTHHKTHQAHLSMID